MKRRQGTKFLFELEKGDRFLVDQANGKIYIANPEYPLRLYDDKLGELSEVTMAEAVELHEAKE